MKTLLPLLVMTFLLTMPQARAASYLIQLKNGGELETYHYWEEGNDIRFYIYGGVAGIPKEFVKAIKGVDLLSQDKTGEGPTLPLPADQQLSKTVQPENKKAGGEGPTLPLPADQRLSERAQPENKKAGEEAKEQSSEKIDINYYKEKKLALKETFNEAWKRYIDATESKDLEAKKIALEEMRGFSKQIYDLADELKKKNQGVLPDWWEQL